MVRVNFFKKIWLAITDFRLYPYTQKENVGKSLWYYLRLILLCAFVIACFLTKYVFDELPGVIAKFDEVVPNFEIVNGELITNESKQMEINADTYMYFSKDKESNDILNIISGIKESNSSLHQYSGYMLILKDQASYVYDMEGAIYQAFKIDYANMLEPATKESIINDLTVLESSLVSKIIVLLISTIVFFIVININRFLTAIIYAITIWLLDSLFALKLKFKNYIIIICYVSTLPLILETIAIIVTRQISSPVSMICTLVSFVYMFYGLRAIKIDNILTKGTGNNPLEKLENAIKEAQEEIEAQLKEEAEKKKEEIKHEIEKIEEEQTEEQDKDENNDNDDDSNDKQDN